MWQQKASGLHILSTVAAILTLVSSAAAATTVTVTPANQNFGNVSIGTASTVAYQVTNSSKSTSNIQVCSLTPELQYFLPSPPALPSQTLTPGQSFSFQVEFFPSQTGTFYGGMAVGYAISPAICQNPAPDFTYTVMVGTGVANPALTVTTFPILPDVPPGFAPAQNYSQTLSATGGAPPYQWALASGSTLPGTLTLSSTGVLTGGLTTVVAGNYSFTVQVTDSLGSKAQSTLTLPVIPQPPGSVAQCNSTPWDVPPGVPPTGTPITPVTDLGTGTYCPDGANCVEGGLYPNGSNLRPSTNNYATNGIQIAGNIAPINDPTNPPNNPAVVLLSIGFSNPYYEFLEFSGLAETDTTKSPFLQFVDGARGDETIGCLSGREPDPLCDPNYWTDYIPQQLSAAGVTANQVEAVWIKETDPDVTSEKLPFQVAQADLSCDLGTIISGLVVGCDNPTPNPGLLTHFPNLKAVYASSRTFGGYTTSGSPETYAYETGYGVQELMANFIGGPLEGTSPWITWGPYLWTNGLTPRSDGLVWTCQDVLAVDGRHPSDPRGRMKVAVQLLNFFKTDATAAGWFNLGPNVGLSPYSLTFGQQAVGTSSAPQTVTLTNTGSAALTIPSNGVTTGPDFPQTNNCGTSVAAGASCTINVTFTPLTGGTLSESLQIADNAENSPQTVSLTGTATGGGPVVTFSPTSLKFGVQLIGTTSKPLMVTLTNSGTATLSITSITHSGDFSDTNNCGTSVAAAGSCTIMVTFRPTASGNRTGSISVADNAAGSPQTVPLTGTGTAAKVSPTSLNFGTVTIGQTSAPQTVTLSNVGKTGFTIQKILVGGTQQAAFPLQNINCPDPGTLGAGASCTVSVSFEPRITGPQTATLGFQDSAGGSPQQVALIGSGSK